jgi:hypothetical protein
MCFECVDDEKHHRIRRHVSAEVCYVSRAVVCVEFLPLFVEESCSLWKVFCSNNVYHGHTAQK